MEQRAKCMGDRPVSLTTSMYFDMKIWMIRLEIRVESGNCQTIQIFENMEIQINFWFFSNNSIEKKLPDPL
jgi:hypothetical protein